MIHPKSFASRLLLFAVVSTFIVDGSEVLYKWTTTTCVGTGPDFELNGKQYNSTNVTNPTATTTWTTPAKKVDDNEASESLNKLAALPATERISAMRKDQMKKEMRRRCQARNGVFETTTSECVIFVSMYTNNTNCTRKTVLQDKVSYSYLHMNPELEKQLTIGGIVISEASLAILIATYCGCKDLQTPYGKSVVLLSITTMVEQVLQLIATDAKGNPQFCTAIGIVQHWVILVMFFCMASIAYNLYQTFAKIRLPSPLVQRRRFKMCLCIAEITPIVIIVSCVIVDFSGESRHVGYGLYGVCFITVYWADIIAFVIPVGCVLVFNFVCLCTTLVRIKSAARQSKALFKEKPNTSKRPSLSFAIIAMKLSFLLGLTWVFGYLGSILNNITLAYIFLVTNSFQGLLIFIAFCFNQKVFRFYKRKLAALPNLRTSITKTTMISPRQTRNTTV
eukprot:gene10899-12058_t